MLQAALASRRSETVAHCHSADAALPAAWQLSTLFPGQQGKKKKRKKKKSRLGTPGCRSCSDVLNISCQFIFKTRLGVATSAHWSADHAPFSSASVRMVLFNSANAGNPPTVSPPKKKKFNSAAAQRRFFQPPIFSPLSCPSSNPTIQPQTRLRFLMFPCVSKHPNAQTV